jgi:hypothetical protein
MSATIDELIRLIDAARHAKDTAEINRLEAEIREYTKKHGQRPCTGKMQIKIPMVKKR